MSHRENNRPLLEIPEYTSYAMAPKDFSLFNNPENSDRNKLIPAQKVLQSKLQMHTFKVSDKL